MSKYFISVIMPIYNAEKYVKKSIDSLVNQTTNEIEIILVDDGSTDGSGSICDQYDGSENVKIIHKENGGICTARNAGLLQAEGQYVSFIDSDDFMDLVAYEKIIKVLKNNQADILDFGWRYVSETGEKTENFHENPKKRLLDKSYIKKQVLPPLLNLEKNRKNFVFDFSWNKIYRKEIIDKYPSQCSGGQQQRAAIARALINDPKIIFADEPTGNLDSLNARELMEYLVKINEEKHTTIIMVTHDSFVASYSKKVYYMKDGHLDLSIDRLTKSQDDYYKEIVKVTTQMHL